MTNPLSRSITTSATLLTLACLPLLSAADGAPVIPVPITLDRASMVTAVIEDTNGRRVCNLVAEVKAAAGTSSFNWDLYDVGIQPKMERLTIEGKEVERLPPYVRRKVAPGTYRVRGLVHDGIGLNYEMSVYSPGNPPWKTPDTSGTWMGDHTAPADALWLERSFNGKPGSLFVAACAESGHALVWTDAGRTKIKGRRVWLGRGRSGSA